MCELSEVCKANVEATSAVGVVLVARNQLTVQNRVTLYQEPQKQVYQRLLSAWFAWS